MAEPGVLVLVLACAPLVALVSAGLGVWIGFRVVTRDAALLARFATEAHAARALAETMESQGSALREEWAGYLDRIERKRASAAGAEHRARAAVGAKDTAETHTPAEPALPARELTPRERRREVQRRITLGGAPLAPVRDPSFSSQSAS